MSQIAEPGATAWLAAEGAVAFAVECRKFRLRLRSIFLRLLAARFR